MKKIRESFHMIAAAVFCLVMSVKATVLKEMGQAVGLSEELLDMFLELGMRREIQQILLCTELRQNMIII